MCKHYSINCEIKMMITSYEWWNSSLYRHTQIYVYDYGYHAYERMHNFHRRLSTLRRNNLLTKFFLKQDVCIVVNVPHVVEYAKHNTYIQCQLEEAYPVLTATFTSINQTVQIQMTWLLKEIFPWSNSASGFGGWANCVSTCTPDAQEHWVSRLPRSRWCCHPATGHVFYHKYHNKWINLDNSLQPFINKLPIYHFMSIQWMGKIGCFYAFRTIS